jgi:mono/diheme cytochrome c family protein
MVRIVCSSLILLLCPLPPVLAGAAQAPLPLSREQVAALPPAAARPVDFVRDIKPILQNSCVKCHGRGRAKGGFSLETRGALLEGGDSGPAVTPGTSETSHLIALVAGLDPDNVMPQKGSRLKPEQIGLLRAWIDQGAGWDASVSFAKSEPRNIDPRQPSLPPALMPSHAPATATAAAAADASASADSANPIDRLLAPYFAQHQITPGAVVDDRVYARRVFLDTIGLLPSPEELRTFLADPSPDKRARLVDRLLADRTRYAEHWLSFWNDALRNDYRGTGFIDGGREQISAWLYAALVSNLSYDRFVAQLIDPVAGAEGFTKGIVWRGVVNASQTPPMQAAQNVSQVFMGVNLKCASCHDSFINDWQLADAYGLAGIYAEAPLELVECDRPTGRTAPTKFLYAKLGTIDAKAARAARLRQLAEVITGPKNGRLSRTIVNRLWAKFMGRGLVEPVDDMEQLAWSPDLLDWLAEDLVSHGYDLKQTMARILTSRAYQLPSVDLPDASATEFRGPAIRRMSAEQFADALSTVTGVWQGLPAGEFDFTVAPDRPIPTLRARWIAGESDVTGYRKTISFTTVPFTAQLLIAYDGPFVLYVNGKKTGEVTGGTAKPRLFDVRSALTPGANVIAIATGRPKVDDAKPPAVAPPLALPAGLFVELLVRPEQDETSRLEVAAISDATWRWGVVTMPPSSSAVAAAPTPTPAPRPGGAAARGTRATRAAAAGAAASSSTATAASAAKLVPVWARSVFVETGWKLAVERGGPELAPLPVLQALNRAVATANLDGRARAALVAGDPLTIALGRPNREQVVTARATAATTLQALELANGQTLTGALKRGASRLLVDQPAKTMLIERVYQRALGRAPTAAEAKACAGLLGPGPALRADGVQDLLWAVAMLPEFQLIY